MGSLQRQPARNTLYDSNSHLSTLLNGQNVNEIVLVATEDRKHTLGYSTVPPPTRFKPAAFYSQDPSPNPEVLTQLVTPYFSIIGQQLRGRHLISARHCFHAERRHFGVRGQGVECRMKE